MQTLHIVGLPHTQWTKDYVSCAYTQKAKKLAIMMSSLGYKVHVYGSKDWDFDVTGDKVTCITKAEQRKFFGKNDHHKTFYNITWGPEEPHWQYFNTNAIKEIKKRSAPGDLILSFSGVCQKMIADALPHLRFVEAGVGYEGVFSNFKVFESYAWMHFVYGKVGQDNGHFYDTVINNYWDITEFPEPNPQDYYLYIGRLIDRKGYGIAQQVCEKLGKRLILAGQIDHEFTGYGEYIGTVGTEERGKLMAGAIAGFVPTKYIGPFEGVAVESMLCGTPIITTNFGCFTEYNKHGFSGYRCDTFGEFLDAAKKVEKFDIEHRRKIRAYAQSFANMDIVKYKYDAYFKRLSELDNEGWYSEKSWIDY